MSAVPSPADIRIIAATNRELPKLVSEGKFRGRCPATDRRAARRRQRDGNDDEPIEQVFAGATRHATGELAQWPA